MAVIVCGWCGKPTADTERCSACGHDDPARPYVQRGQEPPAVTSADSIRRRLAEATAELGPRATIDQIAEHLDVSPRTVRRWREMAR